jgi:outer membrane protein OmpU
MNKLKTIGVSALCGSLAAISAQAGELTVSGGANATYTTKDKAVTGNPLGMATNLSFTGSGELDSGNTFTVGIYHDDQNGFSSADIGVTIAGVGTITLDQGGGTGLDRLDDKTPTAWEEPYDAGLGSGIVTATGVGASTDIEWALDSGFLPEGMNAYISYAFKAGAGAVNDKATGGVGSEGINNGYDVVLTHSGIADGLNLFAGVSKIDQTGAQMDDRKAYVVGGTYAIGGITVGYQFTKDSLGRTTTDYYENDAYGISFAVNDDLSVSYGIHKSQTGHDAAADRVELEAKSVQAAYSMGGATAKIGFSSVDNAAYAAGTGGDYDVTSVMLSLAF